MKPSERGAALLTVLLLVAMIAVIAAGSLEKLRLSTRLSGNAGAIDQARAYAGAAEAIATVRVNSLAQAEANRRPIPPAARTVTLPVPGGAATARLVDGANCFNLNSVVRGETYNLAQRPEGVLQFVGLMRTLEIPRGEAERVASALADYIDSDIAPVLGGAEDDDYLSRPDPSRSANVMLVDPSELRTVEGMTPALYKRLRPWLCALPSSELSPINVNTLMPEQAPLLVMLMSDSLSLDQARRVLAERPPNGYASPDAFWAQPVLGGRVRNEEVRQQVTTRTRWYALETVVALGGTTFAQRALIDARRTPVRVAGRTAGRAD